MVTPYCCFLWVLLWESILSLLLLLLLIAALTLIVLLLLHC
jgi:hypothetical protein